MKRRPIFRPRSLDLLSARGRPQSLATEISAGITVGLIALPLALALGIASLPQGLETNLPAPALGIFTAVIGGFIVSLLGGSRVQIGGPTAAFIPIVLLIVSEHGYSGLLLATIMAGGILILMGLTRMGSLIKYIPWPVTSGFTTGIAIAIILSQLPDFAGLAGSGPAPREFFEKLHWLAQNASLATWQSLLIAVFCVATILVWPKLKLRLLPGSIVALVVATLFTALIGWGDSQTVATIGSKFGADALSASFPPFALPAWDWSMVRSLIGPATAIALLGAIESLLSAVVSDGLSGDHHDSNTELVAQGIANVICPFFGGLPVTGAIARTTANITNGGSTPLSGIIHAVSLLAIILLAANWVIYIPMPAMAAVLIVVALRMGEWHELSRLAKLPRSDALVLLTTFALTVIFDLVIAVEVGMVLAAILFIKRIAQTTEVSRVTSQDELERPEQIAQGKTIPEGVLVYRIFGPFLFGAAGKMEDALSRIESWPRVLILRLHLVPAMDATGMHALISLAERMKRHHGVVILSGIHQQPLAMLRKSGQLETIGRENLCATFDDSLARAEVLLKSSPKGHHPDSDPSKQHA